MDPAILAPWIALAISLIVLGNHVFGWFTSGEKKALKAVAELEKVVASQKDDTADALKTIGDAVAARFQLMESRLLKVENTLDHLPDSKDVVELKLAITEMRGSMNVQAEVMSSVARTVQRLEGYLLEKGK